MKHAKPLLTALALLTAPALMAQTAPLPKAEAQAVVTKFTNHIEALPATAGRFAQTNPDGQTVTGTFYLWRPGRLRFEYDNQPLLVVADGHNVKVQDQEMGTLDTYPIGMTPLKLLLDKDIRLDTHAEITQVVQDKGTTLISAKDAKGEADGSITLRFDRKTQQLLGWVIRDGQGQLTTVQLSQLRTAKLDPDLFKLREAKRPYRSR